MHTLITNQYKRLKITTYANLACKDLQLHAVPYVLIVLFLSVCGLAHSIPYKNAYTQQTLTLAGLFTHADPSRKKRLMYWCLSKILKVIKLQSTEVTNVENFHLCIFIFPYTHLFYSL